MYQNLIVRMITIMHFDFLVLFSFWKVKDLKEKPKLKDSDKENVSFTEQRKHIHSVYCGIFTALLFKASYCSNYIGLPTFFGEYSFIIGNFGQNKTLNKRC